MNDTINVPAFAWYRLSAREAAALLALLAVFAVLAGVSLATRGGLTDVSVEPKSAPPARINVNKAGVAELSALPGIGEKKALKIVEARQKAPIVDLASLARAAGGISGAHLERMKPFVDFNR